MGASSRFTNTFPTRLFAWLVLWRGPLVLGFTAVSLLVGLGALRLEFTTNYRVFFSHDNPQLAAYEALQDTFTKTDNILFVLTPADGNVFRPEVLRVVDELTGAAWGLPYARRVDSLTNFQHSEGTEDELLVHELVAGADGLEPGQLNQAQLERIRAIALAEPRLVGRLVSPAGDVTGVNVTLELPKGEERLVVPRIADQARALARQLRESNAGIEVRLTGILMMDDALTRVPLCDLAVLVPLMFLVVAAILAWFLRDLWATAAVLAVVGLSIAVTMGLVGWGGVLLSPPSAMAPIIIMTLAVADGVHILVQLRSALGRGVGYRRALRGSLSTNLRPIAITSLTTAIGFLGLNFSDVPPFRDLGNIVAVGTVVAFGFALVLFPALLLVRRIDRRPSRPRGEFLMAGIGAMVVRRPRLLLAAGTAVAVFFALFVGRNQLNDEFVKYFDTDVEFRRDAEYTIERLTGLYILEYTLRNETGEGIVAPAFLRTLDAFSQWFAAQPEVVQVVDMAHVIKRLHQDLHAGAPAFYRLPDSREMAAQALLLYEMSLPRGLDLNDRIDVDKSATRLSISLRDLSSRQLLDLEARARAWLDDHAPDWFSAVPSGAPLLFAHISERNIRSMLLGTGLAMVGISLLLCLALGSVRLGLLSLLSNLAPALLAFGLWGLLVGQVGMTLAVVTCLTLGLVVDDTVHFLGKYRDARRQRSLAPEAAIGHAFSTVGLAMWMTSLVLIGGFAVLGMSSFVPNADLGLLSMATIAFALLVDLFILPPILLLLGWD